MRLAIAGILATCLALGASSDRAHGQVEERGGARAGEESPAVAAREAELEAVRALRDAEAPWIDELELRIQQEAGRDGYGAELKARVPLRPLGESTLERSVRDAEVDEARARLDAALQGEQLQLCRQGIEAAAAHAHGRLSAEHEAQLAPILAWSRRAERAGAVTTEAAQRLELRSLSRSLQATRLAVVPPGADVRALPSLPGAALALVHEPDAVARLIRANAPEVQAALGRQGVQAAEAELASRQDAAFVRFVELGVEPVAPSGGSGTVRAQVGVRVPLGDREAQRSARAARAQAARLDVRRAVDDRVTLARDLLAQVDALSATGPRWQELLALAERASRHASQLAAGRIGPPDRSGRLLEEAVEARRDAVDERLRLGLLACDLEGVTGVALEEWPRRR